MEQERKTPTPSVRLQRLPGYGRGRVRQGAALLHRLGSNEAPDCPSPGIVAAMSEAMVDSNRYPDLRGETLAAALAAYHGLEADHVAVAAGSIVVLDQIIRAWCDPGDEVVSAWRSYEAYPIIAGLAGARLVEVPLDRDWKLDPDAICTAIGSKTRVVLICNPNNPTGTMLPRGEIDRLLTQIPGDVLVVLDEAYVDYAAEAVEVASGPVERLGQYGNLVILRTFSKAWGLAGLRVGYCLASPEAISIIQATQPPFPLPRPVLAAALAVLADRDAIVTRVARNQCERERLARGVRTLGLPIAESDTNFIWLPVGDAANALTGHLAAAGIAARAFAGEGVRITTGTGDDTDAVLAALRTWNALAASAGV